MGGHHVTVVELYRCPMHSAGHFPVFTSKVAVPTRRWTRPERTRSRTRQPRPGAATLTLPTLEAVQLFHLQDADRALLSVTEAEVHEWKLARDVAHQLEAHPATRR